MKSFKKIAGAALVTGVLLTSLAGNTSAATYSKYKSDGSDVTVPGLSGIEHWFSSSQTKETTGSAYNNVTKIPDGKTSKFFRKSFKWIKFNFKSSIYTNRIKTNGL